jgi:hypothetical protein
MPSIALGIRLVFSLNLINRVVTHEGRWIIVISSPLV